ncbi:hypothetical protein ELI06_00885 [Rhizobium leguminosarum]|nr:hypothetical protein ELI06_00885 [Rhizobium leguminosarum]
MRGVGEERRCRRHGPFSPFTGRKWRQPDEGPVSAISWAEVSYRLWRHTSVKHAQQPRRIQREGGDVDIEHLAFVRFHLVMAEHQP